MCVRGFSLSWFLKYLSKEVTTKLHETARKKQNTLALKRIRN